jgi:hypothetical protein
MVEANLNILGNKNVEKTKHISKAKVAPRIVTNTQSLPTTASTQNQVDVKKAIKSEKSSFNAKRMALVSPPTSPRIDLRYL